jgi:hypothetical protein
VARLTSACLQSAHPIVNRAARAEDENRRRDAAPPQLFDERQPIAPGKHQIDNRDVVRLTGGETQAGVTVCGVVHGKTGLAQTAADKLGDRRIISNQ